MIEICINKSSSDVMPKIGYKDRIKLMRMARLDRIKFETEYGDTVLAVPKNSNYNSQYSCNVCVFKDYPSICACLNSSVDGCCPYIDANELLEDL